MRLLADECCDWAVVRALRAAGHDVLAIREVMPGAEDATVIQLALRDSRVLVTEDKDFGQLLHASLSEGAGVILLRFPAVARKASAEAVLALIHSVEGSLRGQFAVVEPGRVRVLPRRAGA